MGIAMGLWAAHVTADCYVVDGLLSWRLPAGLFFTGAAFWATAKIWELW